MASEFSVGLPLIDAKRVGYSTVSTVRKESIRLRFPILGKASAQWQEPFCFGRWLVTSLIGSGN